MARQKPIVARWRDILSSVRRAVGGRKDADDLVQSAVVRLLEFESREDVRNPAAFMVRTAINLDIDDCRRALTRREAALDWTEIASVPDNSPLQHEVLEARERLHNVMAGLEALSPRTRDIFLMHRIEGFKYREIAEAMGISVSAVEKHIAKAALFLTNWTDPE